MADRGSNQPDQASWTGPVLTTTQVARVLQLSIDNVRRLSRDGTLPARRLPGGREFRYFQDEILAWLQSQPYEGEAPGG